MTVTLPDGHGRRGARDIRLQGGDRQIVGELELYEKDRSALTYDLLALLGQGSARSEVKAGSHKRQLSYSHS